jgi:hypothetical protein
MRIRVFGQSGENTFPFGEQGPWFLFKKTILDLGHTIVEGDLSQPSDAVIANTHNKRIEKYIIESGIPINKRILVQWEPNIVDNQIHKPKTISFYGHVYAASQLWKANPNISSFYWPQDYFEPMKNFDNWNNRKAKAVIIQGNKFSARNGELYSLRRKVISSNSDQIDLYGTDWNRGYLFDILQWIRSASKSTPSQIKLNTLSLMGNKYANYFGSIKEKDKVLSKYKIAVVIENSADFVSEKLFDAARNGCIPIYCGPRLNEFGINNVIEVEKSAEKINGKIEHILHLSDNQKYELAMSTNIELSQVSRIWDNRKILTKLATNIISCLEKSHN